MAGAKRGGKFANYFSKNVLPIARLSTNFPFSGTFGNLTVYRVGDKCYARTKSSLDRKRFYKDPAFARSREKAVLFGQAARLVKAFYKDLPKEVKQHGLFGKLTAIAYKALQAGKSGENVITELRLHGGVIKKVVTKVSESGRSKAIMPMLYKQVRTTDLLLSTWVTSRGLLQRRKPLHRVGFRPVNNQVILVSPVLPDE